MKHLKYLLCLLLFETVNGLAQNTKDFAQKIEAVYKPIGNTGYFANSCECTNAEYQTFLKADPQGHKNYKYDSSRWDFKPYFSNFESYHVPLVNVYYWHPAYQNYPVNNITQEAAIAYCE